MSYRGNSEGRQKQVASNAPFLSARCKDWFGDPGTLHAALREAVVPKCDPHTSRVSIPWQLVKCRILDSAPNLPIINSGSGAQRFVFLEALHGILILSKV